MTTILTFRKLEDEHGPYTVVDAQIPECGRTFHGVAFIWPYGVGEGEPLVSVPNPLGLDAIRAILERAEGGV